MCGFIACIYDVNRFEDRHHDVKKMSAAIKHRGPDQEGHYQDAHVDLLFRRLSIIDLESGTQPLSYDNERYWIVFNGEIYNYMELREKLVFSGYQFETHSDTEVIVALFSKIGKDVVHELRGMFSFVIWDQVEKTLFGARDQFGIKPLYYKENEDCLLFASEKKSLLDEEDGRHLNLQSIQHYLTYQYVPEPTTMIQTIKRMEPGHYFIKKLGSKMETFQYHKVSFQPFSNNEEILFKKVRETIFDSVEKHLTSDVPVGSFLSGGIDSTIIAAVAKEFSPNLRTFSIGFENEGYSELEVAKETARKLGIINHSIYINVEDFKRELPKIVWHLDDPLADPATIPLYFLAKEARNYVKVVLSGEGADELFGGYNIYREPHSLMPFQYIPENLKMLLLKGAESLPYGMRGKSLIERGCTPIEERYIGNAKMFNEQEKMKLLRNYQPNLHYKNITSPYYDQARAYDPVTKMQYIDIHTWLRGDILLKADKMSMANSLELRVPFLDREVLKVAESIPSHFKINEGTTKWVLRKAFEDLVPSHVVNRKKLGFPVPIRVWLKNELYDWAIQIIGESETDHLFYKPFIYELLDEHALGKHDHSRKIWTVLMFMLWHQVFIEGKYQFIDHNESTREYSMQ
ncbi:asparagine synthase (glutamine-hydrolyzing) [Bacillus mesophilus]|uniref:asparagine synthase (glutamine-hydrolyzing) n=1 Tax=Bacillus mesophilus TaxID=1808955 RepID=A0A6M0Q9G0_9BACI|nr:asparagine synthase (glutamine-hydrolyzing) [Bacillus mesophilus]MBM7661489.1 asparagine synthase (glutamine-hydrolyzing) [Bacillus mesophilus]NEY72160.1 asparagine synthase (glutamine-hydrolyzing) [Bacillus mesophilus]